MRPFQWKTQDFRALPAISLPQNPKKEKPISSLSLRLEKVEHDNGQRSTSESPPEPLHTARAQKLMTHRFAALYCSFSVIHHNAITTFTSSRSSALYCPREFINGEQDQNQCLRTPSKIPLFWIGNVYMHTSSVVIWLKNIMCTQSLLQNYTQ